MSLKISPVAHGNHNNVWFNIKNNSLTMKVVGFYDTGEAYIQKCNLKKDDLDKDLHYNNIKRGLMDRFEFDLKTPQRSAFRKGIRFEDTKVLLDRIQKIIK